MYITKEYLEQQIAQLQVQAAQHLANAQAANGAIEMAKHLLAVLDEPQAALAVSDLEKLAGGCFAGIQPVEQTAGEAA